MGKQHTPDTAEAKPVTLSHVAWRGDAYHLNPMRAVTPAEASVMQYLLAFPRSAGSEDSSPRRLPRRTFQTACRRVLANGWVEGRLIPDPVIIGRRVLSAMVITPYMENVHELLASARNEADCVVLWSFPQFIFGVFLSETPSSVEELRTRLLSRGRVRAVEEISVDCGEASVPAYFDFEGMWAQVMNLGRPISYPQPLGGITWTTTSRVPFPENSPDRDSMARLLLGPTLLTDPAAVTRFLRSRAPLDTLLERRYLRRGYVHPRVMLKVDSIPLSDPAVPSRIVFVTGTVIDQSDHGAFFRELVGSAGVHPFLFLTNGKKVLLASLAVGPTAIPREPLRASTSAGSVIAAHMRDVGYWREELADLLVVVGHRYHQLISSQPAKAAEV